MGSSRVSSCSYRISKLVKFNSLQQKSLPTLDHKKLNVIQIVGLGNYGSFFDKTRHNIGKRFVIQMANHFNVSFESIKGGDIAYVKQKNSDKYVALLKTSTFMNLSGSAVKSGMKFCQLDKLNDLIVVADELDLPFGKYRIKNGGSASGHNGIKSIIDAYGGEKDFKRLLIGIDRPESKDKETVALYVNSNMDQTTLKEFEQKQFGLILTYLNKQENLNIL